MKKSMGQNVLLSLFLMLIGAFCFQLDIQAAEDTTWQNDYEYEITTSTSTELTGNFIRLLHYNATKESHIVPSKAVIDGVEYNVYIDTDGFEAVGRDSIWNNGSIKYISFEPGIICGKTLYNLFRDCTKLETIDIRNLDTSNTTNMYGLFSYCESLKDIDLSHLHTENVEVLSFLFSNCYNLQSVDLSYLDTSSVNKIGCLFCECKQLKDVKMGKFTINAQDMYNMFRNCKKLEKLDLSELDVQSIKHMDDLFHGCENLKEVDLSSFYLDKLESAKNMFYNCNKLEKIITPSYITDKETYDDSMELPASFHDENFQFHTKIEKGLSKSQIWRKGIINGSTSVVKISNQLYTGKEVKPVPRVYIYGNLVSPDNYIVTYTNNVKVGTSTAIITFKGNFNGSKKIAFKIIGGAKKGSTVTKGDVQYQVTGGNTVKYKRYRKKRAKRANIPKTVTINGVVYKVTAIDNKAFSGLKKLTTIDIGANVISIGNSTFKNIAQKKKTITIIIRTTNLNRVKGYRLPKKLRSLKNGKKGAKVKSSTKKIRKSLKKSLKKNKRVKVK